MLTDVVQRLLMASPDVSGCPRVFAIDGRGGMGKSALAERLTSAVPSSSVVHTDDVAWFQGHFDWGGLLAQGVLEPVRRGEAVHLTPPARAPDGKEGAITVPAGLDASAS